MSNAPLTPIVETRAYASCLVVVVLYSGNILAGKALAELPPLTIAFCRVVIACVVLLPIGWRSAWGARATFRRYRGPLIFLTVTGVTFFNTFIYAALQVTSAANVSVLETVIPVVTALLGAWLLRERLQVVQWSGVLLSLAGALWVVLGGAASRGGWNAGDLVMVGALVSWALYSVGVKRYLHLFPERGVLLVMTALSVVILLPLVLLEWLVVGLPALGDMSYWPGLAYLGIFPSVVALLLYNRAVVALGATRASIFLNLLPVVTMIGARFLLDERITVSQVLGAALVVLGVLLTTVSRRRPRSPAMEAGPRQVRS